MGAFRGQAFFGWGESGGATSHNFKEEDNEPQRGSDLLKVTQLTRGGSATQNQRLPWAREARDVGSQVGLCATGALGLGSEHWYIF